MDHNWPEHTSKSDLGRLAIITALCEQHPSTVEYMFRKDKPELFAPPEEVLAQAGGFSHGQMVLLKLSLDVWCWGNSKVTVEEIATVLDGGNFQRALKAIVAIRNL